MNVPKLEIIDAETLLATPLPKTMYIVDKLLPQGLSIFLRSIENWQKLVNA